MDDALDGIANDDSFVDICTWCSMPVYDTEEYVAGDDGEGVMHADCGPEVRDEPLDD